MNSTQNRVAIVTGASSGIGLGITLALKNGDPAPAGLSDKEKAAFKSLNDLYTRGGAYAGIIYTELRIHPSAWQPWILDHDARSYSLISRVFDGQPGGLTRDDILDNITLYWLTALDRR
jgi:hypothetical protein